MSSRFRGLLAYQGAWNYRIAISMLNQFMQRTENVFPPTHYVLNQDLVDKIIEYEMLNYKRLTWRIGCIYFGCNGLPDRFEFTEDAKVGLAGRGRLDLEALRGEIEGAIMDGCQVG
jgi:hypothetical protein